VLNGPGEPRDQPGDRQAEVTSDGSFIAEQVAGHPKGGPGDILEQHGLRLELLEHAGDLVGFRDRGGDMLQMAIGF
jgi:hypothetical protein